METKMKAKEILDYCVRYLCDCEPNRKSKKYKEMVKEIGFMIDTD